MRFAQVAIAAVVAALTFFLFIGNRSDGPLGWDLEKAKDWNAGGDLGSDASTVAQPPKQSAESTPDGSAVLSPAETQMEAPEPVAGAVESQKETPAPVEKHEASTTQPSAESRPLSTQSVSSPLPQREEEPSPKGIEPVVDSGTKPGRTTWQPPPARTLEQLLAAGPPNPDHVLIIMSHFARPDFIRVQHHYFRTFLKENHTVVVVNDAIEEPSYRNGFRADIRDAIRREAASLGLVHVAVPAALHEPDSGYLGPATTVIGTLNAAHRCAIAVQYAYTEIVRKWPGYVLLLDGDMWPVAPASVRELLGENHIAGSKQQRATPTAGTIYYMWNGLVAFNMATFPVAAQAEFNFYLGKVEGIMTDVGGQNFYFFEKHASKTVKVRWTQFYRTKPCQFNISQTNCSSAARPDPRALEATARDQLVLSSSPYCAASEYCAEYMVPLRIFHYRSGGGWRKDQIGLHERRVNLFDWSWLRVIMGENGFLDEYQRYRDTIQSVRRAVFDWDTAKETVGAFTDHFLSKWNKNQVGNHTTRTSLPDTGDDLNCFSEDSVAAGKIPFDAWVVGPGSADATVRIIANHPETNILTEKDVVGGLDGTPSVCPDTITAAARSFYRIGDELYLRAVARSGDDLTCLEKLLEAPELMLFREICIGHGPDKDMTSKVSAVAEKLRNRLTAGSSVGTFSLSV